MNDFERRLSDALKNASEAYQPSDQYAAKERFLQRLRRRRLVLYSSAAGLAGATAALAFVLLPDRVTPPVPEPLPAASPIEQDTPIAVGERPSGVAFGDDRVWVANSGDGTVMIVDPATRRVTNTIEVGGDPDDVAVGVGAAWTSDSGTGTITRIPLPSSGQPLVAGEPIQVGESGSTHMDVAPGAGALWIAKDDSLFRIDPATNLPQEIPGVVEAPSDVAVGEGSVYVLGANKLARLDPASGEITPLSSISPTENQDIAFREGFLWIANGDAGGVTRVDPVTGKMSAPINVGGNFSGIAVDETAVWVISGGASEAGVLTRISPDSLVVVEPRGELTGRPYDITLGAGAVWVVNQSDGTLTALDPDALPSQGEGDPEEREIAFAFAADGDIWAETMDGEVVPLVRTPDADESDPTLSPDGRFLAFARATEIEPDHIVVRDLDSDEEEGGEPGWSPSFGPDGRLAFVRPGGGGDVEIVVWRLAEEPDVLIEDEVAFEAIAGYGAPNDADNIVWDLDGTYLYYNAGWEGFGLYQADSAGDPDPFELIPGNHQKFATYLAPSVRNDLSVHVLRVCCQEPGDVPKTETSVDLGIINFTEGGPEYETVVALDPGRFPPRAAFEEPALDFAGNLWLEGEGAARRWVHRVVRSWFLSWGNDIWLVDANGNTIPVGDIIGPFKSIAGVETAPANDD